MDLTIDHEPTFQDEPQTIGIATDISTLVHVRCGPAAQDGQYILLWLSQVKRFQHLVDAAKQPGTGVHDIQKSSGIRVFNGLCFDDIFKDRHAGNVIYFFVSIQK